MFWDDILKLTTQKFQFVRLDAYIDEDWELREISIVQTWQACEDKLPEELKDTHK